MAARMSERCEYRRKAGARHASGKEGGRVVRVAGSRRRGFTLTEVLVALAVMVILFALLFAPMIAGLDWVSTGRANVKLQDACRYTMETLRRELGEAVYVHRTSGAMFPGANAAPYDQDDIFAPNYSQITFNPPERDNQGRVKHPPRATTEWVDTDGDGIGDTQLNVVVRYAVRLVDPSREYSEENPFTLFRQEFIWDPSQAWPYLGRYNSSGVWEPETPISENALTPRRGATFVPTTTVSWTAGATAPTYTNGYYVPGAGTNVMYLFQGVQFVPQRITGEVLQTDNGIVYKSRYGGWDGTPLSYYRDGGGDPYDFLPPYDPAHDPAFGVYRSELDARIMLYRWTGTGYTSLRTGMDSMAPAPLMRSVRLRWSPDGGAVTCGQQAKTVGTNYYYRIIQFNGMAASGWYNVAPSAGIAAIWPSSSANPQDSADAPYAYRIDPDDGDGAAVIDPESVKVRVVGYVGGQRRQIELKPTENFDQTSIRGDEFCPHLIRQDYDSDGTPDGTTLMLRLSRYDPPRPTSLALFGSSPAAANTFQIQMLYYYRRNATYDATKDAAGEEPFVSDIVKVDYSTRTIQNVGISLQRYTDLEETAVGSGIYRIPPGEHPNEVTVRDQVVARNYGR